MEPGWYGEMLHGLRESGVLDREGVKALLAGVPPVVRERLPSHENSAAQLLLWFQVFEELDVRIW